MTRAAVVIEEDAARQIDKARAWWAKHNGTRALDDAIAKALRQIERFPGSAPPVQIRGKWSDTHRATIEYGYQIFYRYDARAGTVLVRCFWHERRRPPRL